jgi:nucleotide-binding universal stress UspA family protein
MNISHAQMDLTLNVKSILVPYDTSSFSEKSLDYAVKLANSLLAGSPNTKQIRIILLHVVQEIPITKSFFGNLLPNKTEKEMSLSEYAIAIYEEIGKGMKKIMYEKKEIYDQISGINIEPIILYGNPAENIVDFVDKNSVDLTVIGSQGLSGVSKIFKGLGSVSRKVSERISCPIVLIR